MSSGGSATAHRGGAGILNDLCPPWLPVHPSLSVLPPYLRPGLQARGLKQSESSDPWLRTHGFGGGVDHELKAAHPQSPRGYPPPSQGTRATCQTGQHPLPLSPACPAPVTSSWTWFPLVPSPFRLALQPHCLALSSQLRLWKLLEETEVEFQMQHA